jgi:ABC-2 type transport system permease protein
LADLVHHAGVLAQIKLIAGLRWRILRNNLRRKNNRMDLIGLIFAGGFASILVVGLSAAFYAGGYAFLSQGRASWIVSLFWAIFLFWQIIPVFIAGFGSTFEFRTLLRFPLRLTAFYVIGLAYGLADFSAVAAVCWLLSMTAGATAAQPGILPVMLPVVAAFIVLNVTIERLLGSWFERLFARRRTREIFLGLFVLSMISLQFISPFLQRHGKSLRPTAIKLVPYLSVFPPSLAGRAVAQAAQHEFAGALTSFAGLLAYVVIFSGLLWQRFAVQYRGEELSETSAPGRPAKRAAAAASSIEGGDALQALSPQIAAVLRKEFRYLTRNGFAFISLLMPPLLVLLFSSQFGGKHPTLSHRGISPETFFPGMMAYLVLILMAPAYNCFAYEGRGIQTYFMSPLRFRNLFLGKNLLLVSILVLEIVLAIVVFAFRVGLPAPPRFLATLAAIVFIVVGQLSIANWSSLSFPRKLEFGQMRNQRQSGMAVLLAFGVQIVLGGISALILFAGKWTGNAWLPAEAFALLAGAAIAGYVAALDPLDQLAQVKKETLIEALCR